jgi:glutamyl/glutaminyl-tRNA synthetase
MIEDMEWFGLHWDEGPDRRGDSGPYLQSQRMLLYRSAFERLRQQGHIYPCSCSRQDVLRAASAPHAADEDEPLYSGTCRPPFGAIFPTTLSGVHWRFRVEGGGTVSFLDSGAGPQSAVAGADFGDFVVWRKDDLPSYQLACVVDDSAMGITEVVRGADLIRSSFRQILLYRALQLTAPSFHHCPLVLDENGVRLAKRHDALSLRKLRESGLTPGQLRQDWPTVDR